MHRRPETIERQVSSYIGRRHGRLRIVSYAGRQSGYHAFVCLCDCGKQRVLPGAKVLAGKYVSCGCLRVLSLKANKIRHQRTVITATARPALRAVSGDWKARRLDMIRRAKTRLKSTPEQRIAYNLGMIFEGFRNIGASI